MGEQITYSQSEAVQETTAGTRLLYFPKAAFDRAREASGPPAARTRLFAQLARFNTLYMIARAGSGHLGSSFSSLDVLCWLYLNELDLSRDRYFSSKGHDSPALYAVHTALGTLPFENIHALRRLEGLPGHPDVHTPGSCVNTGSLGMGISKAKGFVFADRLHGESKRRIFLMTGDGELQEGQIWESLASAVNKGMAEITVVVDHNKVQSDARVAHVSDLGDLEAKFHAFGWEARRCDGHDYAALAHTFLELREVTHRPKVVIADTVKGSGVSFMAHTAMKPEDEFYRYHSGAPSPDEYRKAVAELLADIRAAAANLEVALPDPVEAQAEPLTAPGTHQRLVLAYTEALLAAAARRPEIVALDADLILDTGLIPFRDRFPDRFLECGIAEQDMVSQAGTMALAGLLPVVHSFACFLSARPNEQIYNVCTEGGKVIYVGTLAGLLPGGPGHSHQAVRDIAALSAMPGMTLIEPATAEQVRAALDWCVDQAPGSCYLRLVSIPCERPPELARLAPLEYGRGQVVREGSDAAIVTYGPVMLAQALGAARALSGQGCSVRVINLPWLNVVDEAWLAEAVAGVRLLVTLDNHYIVGGQGQMVRSALLGRPASGFEAVVSLGLTDIPACGRNDEVLRHHALDAGSIAAAIRDRLT
ncbi:MAG: transketolase [Candidatus Handelsmanbacteria bacterium RIFCSPLOWO2_12_FULL_64_10]|uniref:Transketolase n=1 Tax=Handelsmanbacteria sp. (strain RIFCSPLOWO2_12_FULL_64_10) TaxID=1817868 RepID=A0A1F6CP96_HANXR|nr:MAG: transketolase [Candidatus Handelsmanbacteria bacterium RIFCSPLOWO2_12_FULL_64_10]